LGLCAVCTEPLAESINGTQKAASATTPSPRLGGRFPASERCGPCRILVAHQTQRSGFSSGRAFKMRDRYGLILSGGLFSTDRK
jgi:hypothetical protein